MATRKRRPSCIVIAGPNGAGKTTFAREYLPGIARVIHFVNADLIAGGLSPLKPELAAIAAARVVLRELDRLSTDHSNFAFETTLSGHTRAPFGVLEAGWLPHQNSVSSTGFGRSRIATNRSPSAAGRP